MSTLTEIGALLEVNAVGLQGVSMFLGEMPNEPDTALAIFTYPGGAPEYVQSSATPNQESVQIQIVSRAARFEDADRYAYLAWFILAGVTNAVLSGTKYRSIRPNSSPGLMGRDANDRPKVFFNATVEKEVSLV